MLERSCFHTDREAPKSHKRGWSFSTYHFRVDSPEFNAIEIKACDLEHAIKQAKAMAKREGFNIIEQI